MYNIKNYSFSRIIVYVYGYSSKFLDRKVGAWAYIIIRDEHVFRHDSGAVLDASQPQIELIAAIKALEWIENTIKKKTDRIELFSDSEYLVNCKAYYWWKKWLRNNWLSKQNKPIANKDLWMRLMPFLKGVNYFFNTINTASEQDYYNKCEKIAQDTSNKFKQNWENMNNEQRLVLCRETVV